jgi:Protein of unknown function (DUF4058)
MPMHDWTRVEASIYHAFHLHWIAELDGALNAGLLPSDYYALPEQQAAGFGPDVLTLQTQKANDKPGGAAPNVATMIRTRPRTQFTAESDTEFYLRKKNSIAVHHVSGDRIVAMLELVSPGNKSSRSAFQAFVTKACELLEYRVHLLLLDPFPPTRRDPNGIHAAIWAEVEDEPFVLPKNKPLTLVAYECDLTTRAYIETIAPGHALPDMPLFLEPGCHVSVPLEATYMAAYARIAERWRLVLEGEKGGSKNGG